MIRGRKQTFPGRRTVIGNNETSLGETGDVNIRVREIELLEYSFSCFREPSREVAVSTRKRMFCSGASISRKGGCQVSYI